MKEASHKKLHIMSPFLCVYKSQIYRVRKQISCLKLETQVSKWGDGNVDYLNGCTIHKFFTVIELVHFMK